MTETLINPKSTIDHATDTCPFCPQSAFSMLSLRADSEVRVNSKGKHVRSTIIYKAWHQLQNLNK